ncbi:MAG: YidH family protein [Chloroflexota bacterium]
MRADEMDRPDGKSDGPSREEAIDATRRTRLASERTELAWWRTGLTALAVALAVGRVVPGLYRSSVRWPYVAIGICFALYGVAAIAYGSFRRKAVEDALLAGRFPTSPRFAHGSLVGGGILLGLLTIVLILLG